MTLGDWEVTVSKEEEFENQPGNPGAGRQRMVFYDFKHVPSNHVLHFMIQFIKPLSDEAIEEHLTKFTSQLKTAFIDPLSN